MKNFAHYNTKTVEEFLSHFKFRHCHQDEILFRFGDPSKELYIILHGSVHVMVPTNYELTLESTDVFHNKISCLMFCI